MRDRVVTLVIVHATLETKIVSAIIGTIRDLDAGPVETAVAVLGVAAGVGAWRLLVAILFPDRGARLVGVPGYHSLHGLGSELGLVQVLEAVRAHLVDLDHRYEHSQVHVRARQLLGDLGHPGPGQDLGREKPVGHTDPPHRAPDAEVEEVLAGVPTSPAVLAHDVTHDRDYLRLAAESELRF